MPEAQTTHSSVAGDIRACLSAHHPCYPPPSARLPETPEDRTQLIHPQLPLPLRQVTE